MSTALRFGRSRNPKVSNDRGPFKAKASTTFLDGCLATSVAIALGPHLLFGWWWSDFAAGPLIGAVAAREGRDAWRDSRALERVIHSPRA